MKFRKILISMLSVASILSGSFAPVHIPQELRIRSRGTERHSASN